MELKIKTRPGPGLQRLVTDQFERLRFSLLRLLPGQSFGEELEDWECGLVLLSGRVEARAGGGNPVELGPRKNVFDDPPWGLYVPGRSSYRVAALAESELALSYAPWRKSGGAVVVRPDRVSVHERGRPGFRREVRDIMVDNVDADSLLVGETVNRPGEWSSYPPHKHDTVIPDLESRLEEVYYYKADPPQGFGFQRIYTDDRSLDEALTVENDDLTLLPRGYHPVAAAPGYKLYYFWALAGPERLMRPHNDPLHEWTLEA